MQPEQGFDCGKDETYPAVQIRLIRALRDKRRHCDHEWSAELIILHLRGAAGLRPNLPIQQRVQMQPSGGNQTFTARIYSAHWLDVCSNCIDISAPVVPAQALHFLTGDKAAMADRHGASSLGHSSQKS